MSLTKHSWGYGLLNVATGSVSSSLVQSNGPVQSQVNWGIYKWDRKCPSALIDIGSPVGTRYASWALARTAAQALGITDENGNMPKAFR